MWEFSPVRAAEAETAWQAVQAPTLGTSVQTNFYGRSVAIGAREAELSIVAGDAAAVGALVALGPESDEESYRELHEI